MLKFYFNGAPNPNKVALMLEELEIPFEQHPYASRIIATAWRLGDRIIEYVR
jgi:glutathione S-transferase